MNIEKRRADFEKMKKAVHKKFKGAKLVNTGGRYTIQANGKNVVNSEWPDLQFADTVYDAYHNAFTSEYWTRQYNKKPKKVKASIVNMVGNDENLPINETYNYIQETTELFDEAN